MLDGDTPQWIDRLDRLLPGFGIPNLALYLIGAQVCGFLPDAGQPQRDAAAGSLILTW